MNHPDHSAPWTVWVGEMVVVDAATPYVFVGRLLGERGGYLVLEDADAHDLRDTTTTREKYVLNCREHGVRANRRQVLVDLKQMVSMSRLDDVVVD